MKTPNDHIFRLIKSMSAAEKRYFKIHFASESGLMTELFDHLNQLKKYNETGVKTHFEDSKLAKNLKVYKVQLTESILKSLIAFRHKKSIQDKLRIGIEEINILRSKHLFEVVESKLKQLKKLAIQYELHHYLLQLLQIELDLDHYLLNSSSEEVTQVFNITVKKIANVNRLRATYNQLEQKYEQLFFIIPDEQERSQIRACLQDVNNIEAPNDFAAYCFKNMTQSYSSILLDEDYEAAITNALHQLKRFRDTSLPHIQTHPELFWSCAYILLRNYIAVGNFTIARQEINKIKSCLKKTPKMQFCEFYLNYLEIQIIHNQGIFADISKLEQQFLATIQNLKLNKIKRYEVVKGLIYLAIINIRQENYTKAHFFLRRLHAQSKRLPKIFAQFFDLLELISHYQSGELIIVENLIPSFRRKQYSTTEKSELFNELLNTFSALSKNSKNKIALPLLQKSSRYKKDKLYPLYQYFQLQKLAEQQITVRQESW